MDYQANEAFLDSAIELNNVRRHARNLGYKYTSTSNSYGLVSLFIIVPSNVAGSDPDFDYIPILNSGAIFKSTSGNEFYLTENVDFSDPKNDVVAARFDSSSGAATHYAIRTFGQVISGEVGTIEIDLSNETFKKFRRVRLGASDITEVISLFDSDGNNYYQVDTLSQEVVFLETTNRSAFEDGVKSILKPHVAARRFVVEQTEEGTYLQFGDGSELDDQVTGLLEPNRVGMKLYGKRTIGSLSFDPANMIKSGKLGISPSGKVLTALVKINSLNRGATATPNTLTELSSYSLEFKRPETLSSPSMADVNNSLEVTNDEAIVGSNNVMTKEEIRQRTKSHFAAQNRAVTAQDYTSLIFSMPPQYGSIYRCSVRNDPSFRDRKLSIYVSSKDQSGKLSETNSIIKNNIKNWLSIYRPINDSIEIRDPKIINFGVEFSLVSSPHSNSMDIMSLAVLEIEDHFSDQLYIGEPLYITDVFRRLNKINGVVDVKKVKFFVKTGSVYSSNTIDLDSIMSRDGTMFKTPANVVFELKYPNLDIKGTIK